jgi:succinate-semialdehyde dehydrogenase/glutarate-semialdehyde dehydrogenase
MTLTVPEPRNFIDGEFVACPATADMPVIDPSTGQELMRIPESGAGPVHAAVAAARSAAAEWGSVGEFARAAALHRLAALVRRDVDELAGLITAEMGKPSAEARGEVDKLADAFDYYAEEAVRVYGETIPNKEPGYLSVIRYEPIGVVGAITPWNYPLELIGWKLAASLAAGCSIVIKPSEYSPASALGLMELLPQAGIPDGVVNVVLGAGETGQALASHPGLDKLAFTGSAATGAAITQSLPRAIPTSMELGGSCPLVVTASADLDQAVAGCLRRAFRNAGQICISINRVYVHKSLHHEFVQRLTAGVAALTVGPGTTNPDVGPVVNEEILDRCERHVSDAAERGAVITVGGKRIDGPGNFFAPTVVDQVTTQMQLATEETFGPVVGVTGFTDIEEAIQLANGTDAGLAAYVYASDLEEALSLGARLDFGNVAVNNPDAGIMNAPYGGRKGSGHGYEHGREGLLGFLEKKHMRVRYTK